MTLVYHFSWILQPSQKKFKTMLIQTFGGVNKVHYWKCGNGVYYTVRNTIMFRGQTRCIMGDVQMADGIQSRLWVLDVIVGGKEKEVISKGTGRCLALSFATVVKNSKWHLEHDNFISFITFAPPMSEKNNNHLLRQQDTLSAISTHKA